MIKQLSSRANIHTEWTLYDSIEEFEDYEELLKCLASSQEGDTLRLLINSPGGRADIGFTLVKAMQSSAAAIVCDVIHPSASMASIIALSGDYLIFQKHSYLMFHTYSSGAYGKSDDLMQDVIYTNKHLKAAIDDICYPFFTKKELVKMHDGKDLYICWDDQDLQARLLRKFPGVEIR